MKVATFCVTLLVLLAATSTLIAKPTVPRHDLTDQRLRPLDSHPSAILVGGSPGGGMAKADSFLVFGGPGRGDGDFEDGGLPAWDGWTSEDLSPQGSFWNVSDFYCANLDPLTVTNHAWWCGETFLACFGDDAPEGYGPSYNVSLNWYGAVSDPGAAVTVTINAVLNHDTEPGYDFLYLDYFQGDVVQNLATWDGVGLGISVARTFSLSPTDYVVDPQTGLPSVHLRWHVFSDGLYDQSDCIYDNEGAAQIDLIEVIFDQGTPVQISFEDNEDPDPADNDWRPEFTPGVGDFAKVWPPLADLDPCVSNPTPVAAFIDDGLVVPGTGGYNCVTWCYGPGNYVVNPVGGLAGPDAVLDNVIISPVLTWPGAPYEGGRFSYDVYRHHYLDMSGYNGMFDVWGVQSTSSSDPADLDDAPWLNLNNALWGGPGWFRMQNDVSGLITPDCTYFRLRLGVYEYGAVFGWNGTDSSPAPYFDNVSFTAATLAGPAVSAREVDVWQDSFPPAGILSVENLGWNSIPFDVANNLAYNQIVPGDSLVVHAAAVRWGTELVAKPRMYYKIKTNPLFDPYRDAAFSAEGYVEGDTIIIPFNVVVEDEWAFDLPDQDWFFPGDVMHWYVEARDDGAGPGLTLMPADTTGFSRFPGDPGYVPLQYPSPYVVRALPSLKSANLDDQPRILFWNDFGNRGGEDEWVGALTNLGLVEGTDYDVYYTNHPSGNEGNGLGERATHEQLAGYDIILYSCGNLTANTMSTFYGYPYTDVAALEAWLADPSFEPKMLFLTGDNLVSDLERKGADDFVHDRIGVYWSGFDDISTEIGDQRSPLVKTVPADPIIHLSEWITEGDCPTINTFDAVTTRFGADRLAEFTADGGGTGVYSYAAANLYVSDADSTRVIYFPYDLMSIEASGGTKLATTGQILQDVLTSFGYFTSVVDLTPGGVTALRGKDKVTLNWTNPPGVVKEVEIWRAVWHTGDNVTSAYPEYDDINPSQPVWPADYAAAVASPEWVRVGVTEAPGSSYVDNGLERGIYFYVVYPIDIAGNPDHGVQVTAASYLLGDLTGAGDVPDGAVTGGDISLLGLAYGTIPTDDAYDHELDVGPTDDHSGAGVPVTDNVIKFEDLMIFALNWDATVTKVRPASGSANARFAWTQIDALTWSLALVEPCEKLKGVQFSAGLPPEVAVAVTPGALLDAQEVPYFLRNVSDDVLDVGLALFSPGASIVGQGELFRVAFTEAVDLTGLAIVARDVDNAALEYTLDGTSAVPDLPTRHALASNYPNPFNPATTIDFALPATQQVRLEVFAVDGRRVATLKDGQMIAGRHSVTWHGADDHGEPVAAGVYFYRLQAGDFTETRKMVLLK